MIDLPVIERLSTEAAKVNASIIWLHGLGADGNDFVPVVPQLNLPADYAIRFVFSRRFFEERGRFASSGRVAPRAPPVRDADLRRSALIRVSAGRRQCGPEVPDLGDDGRRIQLCDLPCLLSVICIAGSQPGWLQ